MKIIKLHNDKNKYMAIFNDGKKQKFGLSGYPDFTLTGDVKRRDLYRQRHEKDLSTGDPRRAGYLSYYILWNKPSIEESIRDYKKRFPNI